MFCAKSERTPFQANHCLSDVLLLIKFQIESSKLVRQTTSNGKHFDIFITFIYFGELKSQALNLKTFLELLNEDF